MEQLVNISKTQVVMAFVATCIETTARTLGVGYKEVYDRMNRVNMIEDYIQVLQLIFPAYLLLSEFSHQDSKQENHKLYLQVPVELQRQNPQKQQTQNQQDDDLSIIHAESRENLASNLIECLKTWEEKQ